MFNRAYTTAALLAFSLPATAVVIDFEGLAHGTITNDGGAHLVDFSSQGAVITVNNFRNDVSTTDIQLEAVHDRGVIFNSNLAATSSSNDPSNAGHDDNDLLFLGGWAAGNIQSTDLGNLLIIQEDSTSRHATTDGGARVAIADDEGLRPAGNFLIDFLQPVFDFSFVFVDIDNDTESNGTNILTLETTGGLASYQFSDLIGDGGAIVLGNRSANRIAALGGDPILSASIQLGGSGAIDELRFTQVQVPAPLPVGLLAFGLLALVQLRRS